MSAVIIVMVPNNRVLKGETLAAAAASAYICMHRGYQTQHSIGKPIVNRSKNRMVYRKLYFRSEADGPADALIHARLLHRRRRTNASITCCKVSQTLLGAANIAQLREKNRCREFQWSYMIVLQHNCAAALQLYKIGSRQNGSKKLRRRAKWTCYFDISMTLTKCHPLLRRPPVTYIFISGTRHLIGPNYICKLCTASAELEIDDIIPNIALNCG